PRMADDIGAALMQLEAVVKDRLAAGEAGASYVASLAAKGRGKIAQKVGEEATETIIAALTEGDAALTGEAADLIFHLTVLLAERDLRRAAVAGELVRRRGTSGLADEASREQ